MKYIILTTLFVLSGIASALVQDLTNMDATAICLRVIAIGGILCTGAARTLEDTN